jgi:hypothetical protein
MDPTCGPPDQVDCLLVVPMSAAPGGLVLVGNVEELGNWDPSKGITLRRGPEGAAVAGPGGLGQAGGDTWTARVSLPVGRLIEAKVGMLQHCELTRACGCSCDFAVWSYLVGLRTRRSQKVPGHKFYSRNHK